MTPSILCPVCDVEFKGSDAKLVWNHLWIHLPFDAVDKFWRVCWCGKRLRWAGFHEHIGANGGPREHFWASMLGVK